MIRLKLFYLTFFIFVASSIDAQNFEWANSITGAAARGMAMAIDDNGNAYFAGNVNGISDFDPSTNQALSNTSGTNGDIFLAKYNAYGDYVWHFTIGSSGTDIPKDLILDHAGNLVIVGRCGSGIDFDPGPNTAILTGNNSVSGFVAKYDTLGNFIMVQKIASSGYEEAYGVTVDELDNIYVCGYITETLDFDNGINNVELQVPSGSSQDAYVVKYSSTGNFEWVRGFQGPGLQVAYSVTYGFDGSIYVHGDFIGTQTILETGANAMLTSNGSTDVFIAKYDTTGNFQWVKSIGSSNGDKAEVIRADGLGHIYTFGTFRDSIDLDPGPNQDFEGHPGSILLYFNKLDTAGNAIWAHAMEGNNHFDGVGDLQVDHVGNVFITSPFYQQTDFDPGIDSSIFTPITPNDLYLAKYDSSGQYLWAQVIYTDGTFDTSNGLSIDADGNVFVTGGYGYQAIFDSTVNNGIENVPLSMVGFLAKYGTENCFNTTSSIISLACDSFISPSGITLATSGIYTDTILNNSGCDSIITIQLTINHTNFSIDTQVACENYTWIDGNTYSTNNNTASFTTINSNGCDSIITLNLTLNNTTFGVDTHVACENYTWIDGNMYSANNNTASFTTINSNGCDSIITLNLTLNNTTFGVDTHVACENYTWIDGNMYSANNNTASFTTINSNGCDSILTLNLTIYHDTIITYDYPIYCDSIFLLNQWHNNDTLIFDSLTSLNQCDSIIAYNIYTYPINTLVFLQGNTLVSDMLNASYKWLDCDNGFTPIVNEINQTFTPSSNGNYAVEITIDNCVDTSNCILFNTVPIREIEDNWNFQIYPNPSNDKFLIQNDNLTKECLIEIYDMLGNRVYSSIIKSSKFLVNSYNWPSGVYTVSFKDLNGSSLGNKKLILL